ncbi:MAG: hypothetical protein EAZ95_01530 [Bacteroidetes bacterium]|nr:MAG: hypothetical protein EAZ95_01530 [Bacteroidota bacterium]
MLPNTIDLLEAFKSLPTEEQTAFLEEVQKLIEPAPKTIPDLPIISHGNGGDVSRLRRKRNLQTNDENDKWIKDMRNEWERDF